MSDPAVATGISDLIYESKPAPAESDALDDDLVNAWAANLGDDGLFGKNAPAVNRVKCDHLVIKFKCDHIVYSYLYLSLFRCSLS